MANIKMIPKGNYCYTGIETVIDKQGKIHRKIKICPYWEKRKDKPKQLNGYCRMLKIGDWMESEYSSDLWDMVKECGENE